VQVSSCDGEAKPFFSFGRLSDCQDFGPSYNDEAIDPMNQTTRKFLAKLADLAAVEY
jgi:hypothetical protein